MVAPYRWSFIGRDWWLPGTGFLELLDANEERSLHTGEVEGSIPSAPTIFASISRAFSFPISPLTTSQNGTKREDDASSRGESVDFVLRLFCSDIGEMSDQNRVAPYVGPPLKLSRPGVIRQEPWVLAAPAFLMITKYFADAPTSGL